EFHVESIEPDPAKKIVTIKFSCDYLEVGDVKQEWWVKSGTLILNADDYYTIQEANMDCSQFGKSFTIKQTYQYEKNDKDIPILQRSVHTSSSDATDIYDFHGVVFEKTPESEFRREAFGLK